MPYLLLYSETSGKQIRTLPPQPKPLIRKHLEELKESPFLGKPLERELSGFHSLRINKFRVLYDIDHEKKLIRIHYVGYRKNIYELFRKLLSSA
jgi:mRNA-degrading endonuclease RelE of RelBE toxin-antitoxin system